MTKEVNLICLCGTTTKAIEWEDIPSSCAVCKAQVHVTASLSRIMGGTTAPVESSETKTEEKKKKSSKDKEISEETI